MFLLHLGFKEEQGSRASMRADKEVEKQASRTLFGLGGKGPDVLGESIGAPPVVLALIRPLAGLARRASSHN